MAASLRSLGTGPASLGTSEDVVRCWRSDSFNLPSLTARLISPRVLYHLRSKTGPNVICPRASVPGEGSFLWPLATRARGFGKKKGRSSLSADLRVTAGLHDKRPAPLLGYPPPVYLLRPPTSSTFNSSLVITFRTPRHSCRTSFDPEGLTLPRKVRQNLKLCLSFNGRGVKRGPIISYKGFSDTISMWKARHFDK